MPFKPRYFTYSSMVFFHYCLSVTCIAGIGITNLLINISTNCNLYTATQLEVFFDFTIQLEIQFL